MPASAYNLHSLHTETEKTVHCTVFFAGKNPETGRKRKGFRPEKGIKKGPCGRHSPGHPIPAGHRSGEKEHIERNEEQPQQERHTVDRGGVLSVGADGSSEDGHVRHGGHPCLGEENLGGNRRDRNEGEKQKNAERRQDEPADHGAHKVPVEMNGREGNPAHLHADHKESQRRCRISHILHGGQKEVRQADIQQDQRHSGKKSHQGRRAELFQDIQDRQVLPGTGILNDQISAETPEHGRVGDVVQHGGRHCFLSEQGQIDRKADENGIGNAAGAHKDAPAALRDAENRCPDPAQQVGGENGSKGKQQIRRHGEKTVPGEPAFHGIDHHGGNAHRHGQAGQVLPGGFPEPALPAQEKSESRNKSHFKNSCQPLQYSFHALHLRCKK